MRALLALLTFANAAGCLFVYSTEDEQGGSGEGLGGGAGGPVTGGAGIGGGTGGVGGLDQVEVGDLGALGGEVAIRDGQGAVLSGMPPSLLSRFESVTSAAPVIAGVPSVGNGFAMLSDGRVVYSRSTVSPAVSPIWVCDDSACTDWYLAAPDRVLFGGLASFPGGVAAVRSDGGTLDVLDEDGVLLTSLGDPADTGTRVAARRCDDGAERIVWAVQDSSGMVSTVRVATRATPGEPFTPGDEATLDGVVVHLAIAPDCTYFGVVQARGVSTYLELDAPSSPIALPVTGPAKGRLEVDDTFTFLVEQPGNSTDVLLLACPRGDFSRDQCVAAPFVCGTIGGMALDGPGAVVSTCDTRLVRWKP
ncbi:MAG: hypothetical protein IPM79_12900 [Polyangiaceae bacterium]|nr:hypothetical protein [Polyangiaceae bacterium]